MILDSFFIFLKFVWESDGQKIHPKYFEGDVTWNIFEGGLYLKYFWRGTLLEIFLKGDVTWNIFEGERYLKGTFAKETLLS